MSFVPSTCNCAPYSYNCGCGCPSQSSFSMPPKTAIEWAIDNPVLAAGATAYESDTGRWKLGNGVDAYVVLQYQAEAGADGKDGKDGATGSAGPQGPIGPAGPPNSLAIGTVVSGPTASATITGVPPNQILNLVLPTSSGGGGGGTETGALAFTLQPRTHAVVEFDVVVFEARASGGSSPISYRWQSAPTRTPAEKDWSSIANENREFLQISTKMTDDNKSFRCQAIAGSQTVFSNPAALDVIPSGFKPTDLYVTTNPLNFIGSIGDAANFTAICNFPGAVFYCQWQIQHKDSTSWSNFGELQTSKYSTGYLVIEGVEAAAINGASFRCVFTNRTYGTVVSDTAKLTLT